MTQLDQILLVLKSLQADIDEVKSILDRQHNIKPKRGTDAQINGETLIPHSTRA